MSYAAALKFLEALAAAAQRSGLTFVASILAGGLVQGRTNHVPVGAADVVMAFASGLLCAWLIREIVRPRWRNTRIRLTRVRLPSTSGVDLWCDAAFVVIGIALLKTGSELKYFGWALCLVPLGFACLRLVFWRRRPTAA